MLRPSLAVLVAATGCNSPEYQAWIEQQAKYASTSESSSSGAAGGSTGGLVSTSGTDDGSAGADANDSADATSTAAESTPDTADTTDTHPADPAGPIGDAEKPRIVSVDLPDMVHAAGPVPLAVQTERSSAVQVRLDGVDAGDLVAAGGGLFTGALPVHGAIDNGTHDVEIIARQGKYQDTRSDSYEVAAPAPGTTAWSFTGSAGSRTNRVASTPAGDVIEVGQAEVNGVPRPSIRKRSGTTGAELWPEKTRLLDTLEGAAVDVAVLPDGRMWVAMNVHAQGKTPLPRLALLDPDGHPLGVDVFGDPGRVVRTIAADAEGGCFAAGLGVVQGDWDIAFWRADSAGTLSLADAYDYHPNGKEKHTFSEFANDVLIDGDRVWIVGVSTGQHEQEVFTRGVIVPMALATGAVITANVLVAPAAGTWEHSVFFGGALDADGNVFTTGYGRDADNNKYRIETSRYAPWGERTWHASTKEQGSLAYGSDVALDSQGRVLVAGAVTQSGVLQGYVFARAININGVLFEQWFPGPGPSEALGMLVNTYDRIVPAGYITTNGTTAARIMLIHG